MSERLKMLGFIKNYRKVKRYFEHNNSVVDRYFEEMKFPWNIGFLMENGMSDPDKTLFPLMSVSHISDTPTDNYIMMTWKYQEMEHTLFSKASEWVTMKKFKVHDAGSIGSLGCNCCLSSSHSLRIFCKWDTFSCYGYTITWVYDVLL